MQKQILNNNKTPLNILKSTDNYDLVLSSQNTTSYNNSFTKQRGSLTRKVSNSLLLPDHPHALTQELTTFLTHSAIENSHTSSNQTSTPNQY